jgi:chromate transport protein ChrA
MMTGLTMRGRAHDLDHDRVLRLPGRQGQAAADRGRRGSLGMNAAALRGTATGVSTPVVTAVAVVLAGAWLYHVIKDHRGHLILLHVIRPATVVPEADHDSRWHKMNHPRRLLVQLMMIGAAVLAALAWELAPLVTGSLVILAGAAGVVVLLSRAMTGRVHRSINPDQVKRDE